MTQREELHAWARDLPDDVRAVLGVFDPADLPQLRAVIAGGLARARRLSVVCAEGCRIGQVLTLAGRDVVLVAVRRTAQGRHEPVTWSAAWLDRPGVGGRPARNPLHEGQCRHGSALFAAAWAREQIDTGRRRAVAPGTGQPEHA